MAKKDKVGKTPSLESASIDAMERKLEENLKVVRAYLAQQRKSDDDVQQRIDRWKKVIRTAKAEKKSMERNGGLSKSAQEATQQLLEDAEQRLRSVEAHEVHVPEEERKRMVEAEEAMTSLKSRLEVQRFRASFTQQTRPLPNARTTPALPDQENLTAIDREIRTLTHSIEALKELRA